MTFGATSTTDEVLEGVDLTGTVAVVTGATSGLGLETARALLTHGADVVLAGRDEARLTAAVDAVSAEVATQPGDDPAFPGRPGVDPGTAEALVLDLASLASVRHAAEEVARAHPRIDLLINNAGVMACPLARTADGFEMQFGTNHLGHFLFTNLLLPSLLAAPAPRVVCLSSAGHLESPILWDDPNFERADYFNWTAYGQSKTANALFALELDRRYAARGLHAYAVHPGVIITPLARHLTDADLEWLANRSSVDPHDDADGRTADDASADGDAPAPDDPPPAAAGLTFKSVEAGAATSVWAATAGELVDHGGAYLADCALGVPLGGRDTPRANAVAPWARDPEAAHRLWELSAQLVGLD